jgi:hypothetical protein
VPAKKNNNEVAQSRRRVIESDVLFELMESKQTVLSRIFGRLPNACVEPRVAGHPICPICSALALFADITTCCMLLLVSVEITRMEC